MRSLVVVRIHPVFGQIQRRVRLAHHGGANIPRVVTVGLGLGLGFGVAACSNIAGLSELELVDCVGVCPPAGGSAGVAGTSGNAGTSGASATGGVSAGGTAGSGGTSGAAMGAAGTSSGAAGTGVQAGCEPEIRCGLARTACGTLEVAGCDAPLECGTCEVGAVCIASDLGTSCHCDPGQLTCDGASLFVCEPDGVSLVRLSTCASADDCAAARLTGTCPTCTTGSFACNGAQPIQCDDGGASFTSVGDACVAPAMCDATTGTCLTCQPGAYFCDVAALRHCNAEGTSSTISEVCETPALCVASVGVGRCDVPACTPGETRCSAADGVSIEACNASLTGFEPNGTQCSLDTQVCAGGACLEAACTLGSTMCVGRNRLRCGSTTWEPLEVCGGLEPTCTTNGCVVVGPAMAPVGEGVYAIDTTEVTQAQYADWLSTGPQTQSQTGVPGYCGTNGSFRPFDNETWAADEPKKPVVGVDWCDAIAYCAWAGKTLCGSTSGGNDPLDGSDAVTKSRWFRACVGPEHLAFPYGTGYDPRACNGASNNLSTTVPVASLTTCEGGTPGVFDMSGNAREWEASCEPLSSPTSRCLVRGGGFSDVASSLNCSSAVAIPRDTKADDIGFRCCSRP